MSHKLTTKEFISQAKLVHGDKFSYDRSEYKTALENITVTCKVHGDFEITPDSHKRGNGCAKCKFVMLGNRNRGTLENFLLRAKKHHGERYDYSKVDYKDSKQKLEIICKEHGSFFQSANSHGMGRGCPDCGDVEIGKKLADTTENFISKAQEVHGLKYDYSETKYTRHSKKLDIICRLHGKFTTLAATHLRGCDCPKCSKHGYKIHNSASFYVLQAGNLVKIGITNNEPKVRARKVSKSSNLDFKVKWYVNFENGTIPLAIESILLSELRASKKSPPDMFDGSTECFYDVSVTHLLNRATEVIKNIDNVVVTITHPNLKEHTNGIQSLLACS